MKDANDVQVIKLDQLVMPTVKAIASAMINAGADCYTCTIAGKKVKIIK